jgi:predicted glycoside hydrolase/deacetylase ChbG (UPF0249 family)
MKVTILSFLIAVLFTNSIFSQTTIAEQLGYEKEAKLLIVHADDLGVAHSENAASFEVMAKGCVNSASIMVPCPWFLEAAKTAVSHPQSDYGLHLTLNSEWENYKWGPVSGRNTVPSLVDSNGYFFDNIQEVAQNGKPEEVLLELDNQVEMALANGIDVTHLDAHMGTAISTKEFLKAYIKVGNKYELPVLLDHAIPWLKDTDVQSLVEDGNQVVIDQLYTAGPQNFKLGMADYYRDVIENLTPGLNVLLIHLAYDDVEMQAVTIEHPDWGAAWRQADTEFFGSDACRTLISDNKIILVDWREIRDKIIRQ